jgi:hypothetical protein
MVDGSSLEEGRAKAPRVGAFRSGGVSGSNMRWVWSPVWGQFDELRLTRHRSGSPVRRSTAEQRRFARTIIAATRSRSKPDWNKQHDSATSQEGTSMPQAEVDGLTINYELQGEGERARFRSSLLGRQSQWSGVACCFPQGERDRLVEAHPDALLPGSVESRPGAVGNAKKKASPGVSTSTPPSEAHASRPARAATASSPRRP